MTLGELSRILHDSYENAPRGDKMTALHLISIKYSDILDNKNKNFSIKELLKAAGISESLEVQIHAGIRLAKHVTLID